MDAEESGTNFRDAEEVRIYVSQYDFSKLTLAELVEMIARNEADIAIGDALRAINIPVSPELEATYSVKSQVLKKCYAELDKREQEYKKDDYRGNI